MASGDANRASERIKENILIYAKAKTQSLTALTPLK